MRGFAEDFHRGFAETLGEDSCKDLRDFGERILQGFARLLERIRETLGEDSRDFGRGFARLSERIRETLGEDSQ